jgi:hypothetical protein
MNKPLATDPGRETEHQEHQEQGDGQEHQAALSDLQRRLDKSEQRLAVALRVTGLGSWEWEPEEDRLLTSEGFTSLLGLPPGTELGKPRAMTTEPWPACAGPRAM